MPPDPRVWYATPRWQRAHYLDESPPPLGAAVRTLCGRWSGPDDYWTPAYGLDPEYRCGRCQQVSAARAR